MSHWIVEQCSPKCLVQWTPDEVLLILQTLSQNYLHLHSPKAHLVMHDIYSLNNNRLVTYLNSGMFLRQCENSLQKQIFIAVQQ